MVSVAFLLGPSSACDSRRPCRGAGVRTYPFFRDDPADTADASQNGGPTEAATVTEQSTETPTPEGVTADDLPILVPGEELEQGILSAEAYSHFYNTCIELVETNRQLDDERHAIIATPTDEELQVLIAELEERRNRLFKDYNLDARRYYGELSIWDSHLPFQVARNLDDASACTLDSAAEKS